jgi:hypothetical protein
VAGHWRVLAGALALAGCGSVTPASPPPPPSATVAAAVTAVPTPTPVPVLVGGVAVEDLCTFLAGDVPRLQQQGAVGAVALLASDIRSFYAYQGLPRPDGAVIDRAILQACPETRFAVLVVLKQPNLNSL